MKRVYIAAALITTLMACSREEKLQVSPQNSGALLTQQQTDNMFRYAGSDYSQPIHKDTAENLIASYQSSIGCPSVDSGFQSLSFSASTMRSFLSNSNIATIKFFMAHPQSYINNGNYGVFGGVNKNALTIIMSGLNDDDQYVHNSSSTLYDLRTSAVLPFDTASKMIQSYLTSVDYLNNITKLQSLTFDADTLRSYLANTSITTLKLFMAHKESYVYSGNYGTYGGNHIDALTLVIVGYNNNNQKVFYKSNKVMDHMRPCPKACESSVQLTR